MTIQLWETASRRRVGRAFSGLTGDVTALLGLDTSIVAADESGDAYRWQVNRDARPELCEIVSRPLTRDEWDTFAGGALTRYEFDDPCAD